MAIYRWMQGRGAIHGKCPKCRADIQFEAITYEQFLRAHSLLGEGEALHHVHLHPSQTGSVDVGGRQGRGYRRPEGAAHS